MVFPLAGGMEKEQSHSPCNQQVFLQLGLQATGLLSIFSPCSLLKALAWSVGSIFCIHQRAQFILCCSLCLVIQVSLSSACLQEIRLQIAVPSQTPQEGLLYKTVMDCRPLGIAFQTGVAPDPGGPGHTATSQGCHHLPAVTNGLKSQLEFTGLSSLLHTT